MFPLPRYLNTTLIMLLFLLRHAEALDSSPDSERILSENGRAQVSKIVRAVPRGAFKDVPLIEHSPYRRATETAGLLKKHALPHADLRILAGITPNDSPQHTATTLATCPEVPSRLIIGHNPHITLLASLLLSGGHLGASFGPATCMALERYSIGDRTSPFGYWQLLWFVTPEFGEEPKQTA